MLGLIQFRPLVLQDMLEFAGENFSRVPVVSYLGTERFEYTYQDAAVRARRLASTLQRRGYGPGTFFGSLSWTTHRHFELMYAVPGIGAVLHTANPRLSHDHIRFSINHARDCMLFVDPDCLELVEELAPQLPAVREYVLLGERSSVSSSSLKDLQFYEELIDEGVEDYEWPEVNELSGSTLCFTSGTTGDPKGILYSHRGSYLSSLALAAPNHWGVSERDVILAAAPFFHCNGWGAPYLGPMVGAPLVLPGRAMDGKSLHRLIKDEGVTVGPGVPTVWNSVLEYCRDHGQTLEPLNRIVCGGAAPPLDMMRSFWREHGVRTVQVWGMTETTHAATLTWTAEDILSGLEEPTAPQGRPVFGTDIRTVSDEGAALPNTGAIVGHLQVRGHACASAYLFREDLSICDSAGWLKTGDLATISQGNGLRITDRVKDVIKSGGEWVSSIDLENAATSCPGVRAAAVIGVPHPKWQERPIMFVIADQTNPPTAEAIRNHLSSLVAKWWLPDEIVFVDELPYSSNGKVKKDVLRAQRLTAT
jgi:fatty-acyl-CoA synthase